ncbi:MAG: alpha/beta hydrolase [Bryobacteraceae bacterium]|jgi:acetyl esterase/lipase
MKTLIGILLAAAAFAADPKEIPLYPGAAPGSENATYAEQETIGPQDHIRRISNITHPVLLEYLPESAKVTGTVWIVCPGGGFRYLAIDYEGTDVARWLNANGVAALVLKYRVARTGDDGEKDPATAQDRRKTAMAFGLADGQQAVRMVRSHAAEWGIVPDRIGIIGFSAGGYVAAAVALHHDAASRPNFAAPIYPAVPADITVPADAPPLFLAQADDDASLSTVDNTVRLYTAWKKANIPAEMHIYLKAGHGFGMKKLGLPTDTWIDRFHDWLGLEGLLKPVR